MNITFDIILNYYDNPILLFNWIHRLTFFSDYLKYSKNRSKIIIADSGTPLDKIDGSLSIYKAAKSNGLNIVYLRAETEEIRKKVPLEIEARLGCHAYNMALDYSQANIIYTSVVGHIYSPKYFEKTLVIHLQDEKAVILPKRFDLDYKEYHESGYQDSWKDIINNNKLIPSGGWPDGSFGKKWALEIGGFDENYITISPIDMDFYSRLGNFLDDGTQSNRIFPNMPEYNSLKLNFYQPSNIDEIISLTCNQYKNHIEKGDSRRQIGYDMGIEYYLKMWGIIKRNQNRVPLKFVEY